MNKGKKLLTRLPIHPVLIGVFPTLALFAHNILEIKPEDTLRAFLLAALGSLLMVVLFRLILPGWPQAAWMATLAAVLVFSYGHVYSLLEGMSVFGITLGRHRYLAVIWFAILVAGWWGARSARETLPLTRSLNLIAVVLWVVPLFQIALYQIRLTQPAASLGDLFDGAQPAEAQAPGLHPDIYYLILDAYTRDDTILELYRYDNTPFLDALRERGFYVALCSQSNYARTYLSLSSSLNLNYIQDFYTARTSAGLTPLIQHSQAREILERNGYTSVAIETGFFRTEWEDAEYYFERPDQSTSYSRVLKGSNEFEAMLVNTTAGLILLDVDKALGGNISTIVKDSPKFERYVSIRFVLDTLERIPPIPGPKLVFAHVRAPHAPYIFSAEGEFLPDQEDFVPGYRDQLQYVNKRVLALVDQILESSGPPPIIVIQGDHGGDETKKDVRRLHILNAYLLPPEATERLYPTITPVNTFRLILDTILGTDYGLLEDISYYSPPQASFDFSLAPNLREGCEVP